MAHSAWDGRERSLLGSAELLYTVLSHFGGAVALLDDQCVIRYWNTEAERLFGWETSWAVGRSVAEIGLSGPDAGNGTAPAATDGVPGGSCPWGRRVLAGERLSWNVPIPEAGDGERTAAVTVVPLRGRDGEVVGSVLTGTLEGCTVDWATWGVLCEALFEQSPVGVGVYDDRGRYIAANQALQDITGRPLEDMLGRSAQQVMTGQVGEQALRLVQEVIDTGVPVVAREIAGAAHRGAEERAFLVSYFRLAGAGGDVLGAASMISEVTEVRRTRAALQHANERLALLERAGHVMGESLDVDRTLAGFADLVVPRFADHCVVDLVDGHGTLRRRVLAHSAEAPTAGSWLPVGSPPAYPARHPVSRALATGQERLLVGQVGDFDTATEPDGGPVSDRPGGHGESSIRSLMALPLRTSGRLVGVVSLATSVSGRSFGTADLALAGQLADRAAVAIDNALLYRHQRDVALTLQHSILPERLPRAPGLAVAARYLAATEGEEVGGDWYDLIPMSAGRVGVVVGDVMGRGVAAAALMGQIRAALRAYAVQDLPPGEVLTRADELVRGLAEDIIVTCVYGVYDARDERLVLANAGHVPPLLIRRDPDDATSSGASVQPGDVLRIEACGPPLGAAGPEPYSHVTVDLPASWLLALYTDGLVETREADLDQGIERLLHRIGGARGDLESVCEEVLAGLCPSGSDDTALLLLSPERTTRPRAATFPLPAQRYGVRACRAFAVETLTGWGFPGETVATGELLADELVTNAVQHTGADVVLVVSDHGDGVFLEVRDSGDAVPRVRTATAEDERGRGLMVVAGLSTRWGTRILPEGGKAVWCHLGAPADRPDRTDAASA